MPPIHQSRARRAGLCCLAAACLVARPADARGSPSVVTVSQGQLQGSCDASGVCRYLGIPYAAPPIGNLRWKPPQPARQWHGVRDAGKFGSACLQPDSTERNLTGSESCLFLNVYAPLAGKCQQASCPVMFWIHGGAYITGSAASFDGGGLVGYAGDVVVVTINYRLGVLGFLGSQSLRGRDAEAGSTGNYGIQDQRAALRWVRRNIRSFGGNASNVMVFGESAGGGSVSMHLTMRRSWPLYHKAAIESGAFSYWTAHSMPDAEKEYAALLVATNCNSARAGTSCLLGLEAWKVVAFSFALPARALPHGAMWSPTADGVELAKLPWELLEEGRFNAEAPVLVGYNKDEGTLSVDTPPDSRIYEKVSNMTAGDFARLVTAVQFGVSPAQLPDILDVYSVNATGGDPDYLNWYWTATHFQGDYGFSCPSRRTARAVSRFSSSGVFLYYFAHVPKAPPFSFAGVQGVSNTAGASHASEISFVWLSVDPADAHRLIGSDEVLLGKTMAGYWVNFARTSDPNLPGHQRRPVRTGLTIDWEPFVAGREASIRFDLPKLSIAVGRDNPQCDLIDKLGVLPAPPRAVPRMPAYPERLPDGPRSEPQGPALVV